MYATRIRAVGLAVAASLGLAACSSGYGYSGVSVGYGNAGYYDPYYGGGYGGYGSGWYNDYYYPGSGYYVYSRSGQRHRWSSDQRVIGKRAVR